jgi:hypothetical protein
MNGWPIRHVGKSTFNFWLRKWSYLRKQLMSNRKMRRAFATLYRRGRLRNMRFLVDAQTFNEIRAMFPERM